MKRFHALEKQPSLLRMSRIVRPRFDVSGLSQTGGGVGGISKKMSYRGEQPDVSDDGDTESDMDNERSETDDAEGESETDDAESESETGGDSSDERDDENWVFNRILFEAECELNKTETITHERLRELFMLKYTDYLVWIHDLRRNPIHRKVMTTAKDLEDGVGDFDRIEALKLAVNQRRYMLEELVPEPKFDDASDDEDTTEKESYYRHR